MARMELKAWQRVNGKNTCRVIEDLRKEMREKYQINGFGDVVVKRNEEELRKAIKDEEHYWKVHSRVNWLQSDDKNTIFFSCSNSQLTNSQ